MIEIDGEFYEVYPLNNIIYEDIKDKLNEEKALGKFKSSNSEDIIKWHNTLGRYIRNTFLYDKTKPHSTTTENCIKLSEQNEDEMSYTIMVQVHNVLNKGYTYQLKQKILTSMVM